MGRRRLLLEEKASIHMTYPSSLPVSLLLYLYREDEREGLVYSDLRDSSVYSSQLSVLDGGRLDTPT